MTDIEEKKEPAIPMTGIEVMNYLSIDVKMMFHLVRERLLLPRYPKDPSWIKLQMNSWSDSSENYLSKWIYWESDVEDFKKKHKDWLEKVKLPIVSKDDKEIMRVHPEENTEPENFIRSIQVSYLSDTEIKIKIDGKKAKKYDMKELGFKKINSKTWKEFIGIIKRDNHLYHTGTARGAKRARKTSYDLAQKVLVEINKKLVTFLNKTYPLQLPERFKIHELIPEKKEAPGTYRFKFQITNNEDADIESFKALPKDQLLQQIRKLSDQKKTLSEKGDGKAGNKLDKISDQLSAAVEIACRNGWLTENRARNYLNPSEYPLMD